MHWLCMCVFLYMRHFVYNNCMLTKLHTQMYNAKDWETKSVIVCCIFTCRTKRNFRLILHGCILTDCKTSLCSRIFSKICSFVESWLFVPSPSDIAVLQINFKSNFTRKFLKTELSSMYRIIVRIMAAYDTIIIQRQRNKQNNIKHYQQHQQWLCVLYCRVHHGIQ